MQAGKAEFVAASEPRGWDLHSPLPGDSPHLPDMAEGVLVLSGVELISFSVAVQFWVS